MNGSMYRKKYYISLIKYFFALFLIWTPMALIGAIFGRTFESFFEIELIGVIMILSLFPVLLFRLVITIEENGMRVRNPKGEICFLNWNEIKKIKPYKFLNLEYIKVFTFESLDPIQMPLTMNRKNDFINDINNYAPEENPLKTYFKTGELIASVKTEEIINISSEVDDSCNLDEKAITKKIQIQNTFRNGFSWFYWIAGLSLINTVILLFGGELNFVIGLGTTQLIDGIAQEVLKNVSGQLHTIIRAVSLVFDFLLAGIFIVLGFLAKKRYRWSYILGMVLYGIDGLLFLIFQDYISVGFHIFVLLNMLAGYKARNQIIEMEKKDMVESNN